MKKSNIELKRVNINLSVSLVEKIKDYAIEMGIPVTQAISFLINKGLLVESMLKEIKVEPRTGEDTL